MPSASPTKFQNDARSSKPCMLFPDPGDWNYWLTMQEKIQIMVKDPGFQASGALAFIPKWVPVLTNPTLQSSQDSMTGFKEGLKVCFKRSFWANQYASPINSSLVVQTARVFLQSYLYEYDDTFEKVVSINSTFSTEAIGNSLGPSDACPAFAASRGTGNATNWANVWVPKTLARVNSMVKGNLTLDETDLLYIPYLCGYESQILGRLSP
ncbi:hypothetical protein CFD26_101160 [Aspergillus turcosus]|uniref:Uncharacterized protein n=1 Tax=Aspergillus turcosus TaxID=1245748 RepID=A0A421CT19_9EURO|nr:hypothetical protein CFD26_101160 [Aspergillus turcosus]